MLIVELIQLHPEKTILILVTLLVLIAVHIFAPEPICPCGDSEEHHPEHDPEEFFRRRK